MENTTEEFINCNHETVADDSGKTWCAIINQDGKEVEKKIRVKYEFQVWKWKRVFSLLKINISSGRPSCLNTQGKHFAF